jgi:hypothetical protein
LSNFGLCTFGYFGLNLQLAHRSLKPSSHCLCPFLSTWFSSVSSFSLPPHFDVSHWSRNENGNEDEIMNQIKAKWKCKWNPNRHENEHNGNLNLTVPN